MNHADIGSLLDKFERTLQGAEFNPVQFRRTMECGIARGVAILPVPEPIKSKPVKVISRKCAYCKEPFTTSTRSQFNCSKKCWRDGRNMRRRTRKKELK